MKYLLRLLATLMLLTLITLPIAAQSATYVSPRYDSVNVRMGPGLEHGVIVELFGYAQYPVVGSSATGNWLLIDLGYGRGWVHQAYVNQSNYNIASMSSAPVAVNIGQGGGVITPQVQVQAPLTYTVPTTTQATTLGQGGGFAMPYTTSAITTTYQTTNNLNTTIGSWVGVNIRNAPDMHAGMVAIMPVGDRAVPLGRNSRGTWYFVDYNGARGWVNHAIVAFPPNIDATALPVVSNQ